MLTNLLGEKLQSSTGIVDTASALQSKKVVGLYFSAHWCPPCRGFTPKLAEVYKGLKESGKSIEIVFVSSDKDEGSFNEYFAEQPWLALPYAARDKKQALSKKYKVNGIPTLVLLDGETGSTLTTDGRTTVMEDPKGCNFPWPAPTLWDSLGDEFMTQDGDTVEVEALKGKGKVIMLYFSAHWCPPCRGFTPELVKTVAALKKAGTAFETIFVSSDEDTKSFQEYFASMTGFLAIPNGDPRKGKLSKLFNVEGIPTLVTINAETGETINANARGAASADPVGAEFPWKPKPIVDLATSADGINEEVSLCMMMEGCSSDAQAAAVAMATPLAEAAKGSEDGPLFFIATSAQGPAEQIRKLTGLGDAGATPQLLLLDIPDEGGFYVSDAKEVSAKTISGFIAAYKAGSLSRKQLGGNK